MHFPLTYTFTSVSQSTHDALIQLFLSLCTLRLTSAFNDPSSDNVGQRYLNVFILFSVSSSYTLSSRWPLLRTGVGLYRASMKKWGLADSAACECGEPEQTADHIINSCPLHRPPSEAGLFEVGPLTRAWLQQTELNI